MKHFILLILISLSLFSYGQDAHFGENISNNNIIEFSKAVELGTNEPVKIQGEIIQTCAKKGCWMTLAIPGEEELRVTFKDYGFFVPKEGVEGKKAIVEGELIKSVTDVETLRHFAEDAGKSKEEIEAITEPKEEYSFIATGVVIKE